MLHLDQQILIIEFFKTDYFPFFSDDLSEDLSLGLILDDRDDSVFAGGWSDEDEELEDEFVCTPRHLPTLDENDDSETDFNLQQRRIPSRYSIL